EMSNSRPPSDHDKVDDRAVLSERLTLPNVSDGMPQNSETDVKSECYCDCPHSETPIQLKPELDSGPENPDEHQVIIDNDLPSTSSENRHEPKPKSSKVTQAQTRKSARVAQLEKSRSKENDQNKSGPSGMAKKRKMADREENQDAQQAIIDDSPSTS